MIPKYLLISFISFLPILNMQTQSRPVMYSPYKNKYEDTVLKLPTEIVFGDFRLLPTQNDYLRTFISVVNASSKGNKFNFSITYIDKDNYEATYLISMPISTNFGKPTEVSFSLKLDQFPKDIKIFLKALCVNDPSNDYIFPIKLTNPLYIHDLNESNRIYYLYEFFHDKHIGRNYYSEVKIVHPNGYKFNKYYYDHFNFYNDLKVLGDRSDIVYEPFLYIKEKDTKYFDNCTFKLNEFPEFCKFFTLNSTENVNNGLYTFKYGKQYFVNTLTHQMSYLPSEDNLEITDRVYLPIDEYKIFKDTEFGLYFKFNINICKYKVKYDFKIHFQNNYYKDDALITKEFGFKTSDSYLKEVQI